MDALTWIGSPRKFVRTLEDQSNVTPVVQQIELRLRSDGFMFYRASQIMNDKIKAIPEGEARDTYFADREQRSAWIWDRFLTDEETAGNEPVTKEFFKAYVPNGFTEVQ